jgi:hypothetical protein
MTKEELGEWLRIFQRAYTEAASPGMKDSPSAATAQILFACLTKAVFEAIVAKDAHK